MQLIKLVCTVVLYNKVVMANIYKQKGTSLNPLVLIIIFYLALFYFLLHAFAIVVLCKQARLYGFGRNVGLLGTIIFS